MNEGAHMANEEAWRRAVLAELQAIRQLLESVIWREPDGKRKAVKTVRED